MSPVNDPFNPEMAAGDRVAGFLLQRKAHLPEAGFTYYELEHEKTGAGYIHISCDDRENTFGVTFKTVPQDSSGVAHILEHTVLCGSARFPVRDPFFSMLKRSLSTFMNAFTASDWTMYPFSTQNRRDFYNLLDVYLDAAFHPRLDPLNFKQEGHRIEVVGGEEADADAIQLDYKGVVYNEMKGAMSSPDQVMARSLLKFLYPSTTYHYNSGGDPAVIPRLTYEQLKAFHRRHYHPSNALFYSYGNLPFADHLAFIEERVLKTFERIDPGTEVPSQPRWQQPREALACYPLSPDEATSKKSQVALAWLACDIRDTFEVLVLAVLEQILLGNPASPLRKALIESQLGTALCDAAGYDDDNRDTLFVCGLKGVAETDAEKIEQLVFNVLTNLATSGIDSELIESAIHQIEFHRKEVTNTPYPYGLKQLLTIAATRLHGGDALRKLRLEEDIARIRQEVARGGFFEGYLRKYFLENPHRLRFKLVPDLEMEKKEEERIAAELRALSGRLQKADIEHLRRDAQSLKALQEAPEDLSILPTLRREDIPPEVPFCAEAQAAADLPIFSYDQRTSGIFYFTAVSGVGHLDGGRLPLLPFFCYALPKVGTRRRDYVEMARRIDLYTGGVSLSVSARSAFDGRRDCVPFVAFGTKCLYRNQDRLFDIAAELMDEADFSDLTRLKNVLLEYRAALETMVIHNGHRLAISLASRNFSINRYLNELWSGILQLQTVKGLSQEPTDEKMALLAGDLAYLRRNLFTGGNLQAALIGEESVLPSAIQAAAGVLNALGGGDASVSVDAAFGPPSMDYSAQPVREGWSTATAVSFVAKSLETVRMEHPDAPALAVLGKLLRSLYLHREIREKGGAYGGFSLYNPEDGLFCFASYRDPHIVGTLDVYGKVADFLQSDAYDEIDIDEAVLQVCSEIDRPDPPGPAARKAFFRKIIGLSDDARQHFKTRLLACNREQVQAVARRYFIDNAGQASVAVISGEKQLQEANKTLAKPLVIHRI